MNSTQSTFGLTRQTFESEAPLNTMEKGGGFFDNTFKFANYRKRRLSKVPSVIIPPPSIIIAPVSPPSSSSSKSDSYFEQPSPKTPSSPKRFVLKPITALTAAFQKTTITGRNKSSTMNLLKFQKSPKSPKPVSSPQSPKPPKLLHRKGSSGSIRKRSESPTTTSSTATTVILPPSQTPTNNKLKTKLGGGKFKTPKSCRKALPIVPSELAERLRESCSFSAKFEQVNAYNNYHCQPFLNKLFQPILIDVRNLSLYQDEHIRDSFNVNLPTLLIKRFRRGTMNNFSLDSFITTPEGRDKYLDIINDNGDKFQHDIIIFDDNMDENDKVSPGWTLLNVLELNYYHSNLSTDSIDEINELPKGRVYWLKGGFEAFKSWDQRGEFIVTDNDNNNNNENNDKMECEDKEQQGSNLIRRDSLFSVNTERSSFRRKKSIKNPELVEQSSQQQQQQPQPQQQEQLLPLQLQQNHEQKQLPQLQLQSEFSRVRRPSNGLQYLFTPTNNKLGDSLTLYPTASYGVHDFPDSDEIPDTPIVSHPEAAFVVSTIIPGFLFLGPEITKQEEVKELKDKGVKRVLNMAFECDDSFKEEFDRYLKLNVKDSVEEDVENGLKIAVGFIERAQKDNTPIYVHCKAGKSRSVTAVLAYLIKSRQWTLKYAYDYVMERRSGISPNIGFVAELMRIEESVFGFKRNGGVLTEVDFRNKGEIMDMEGVESLSKTPKTAFF